MTTVAVVQCRMGSTRLPGKALYPLEGRPVLGFLLRRLTRCAWVDRVTVATTSLPEDAILTRWAEAAGVEWLTHHEPDDVLTRFLWAAEGLEDGDVLVRLTGDNPLVCPEVVDDCARWVASGHYEYYRTGESFPEGLDVEAFTVRLLRRADMFAAGDRYLREHLAEPLAAVAERPGHYELPERLGHIRLTLDVPHDVAVVQRVAAALGVYGDLRALLRLVREQPDLFVGNQQVERNTWQRSVESAGAEPVEEAP